ncbi:MAG: hypothetical protein IPI15_18135 [Saprospiraceae bacterium]|uniref:hypothetical protein n=1 Tax=Candidatus Brachybacter algidus TaxID=2982024 RepID=UPI00257DBCA4|nr:hypothetical protein [Candidatus Brachybacter algidus]MBK7605445.1 hypothetical protein [Candidatus Brachybacter algidus]
MNWLPNTGQWDKAITRLEKSYQLDPKIERHLACLAWLMKVPVNMKAHEIANFVIKRLIQRALNNIINKKNTSMPCGKKRKRHKIATHKRKKD